ncbi:putative RiPP precursor [Mesorhizobium sp. ORS 3428]|nr:putative RiPP precursor [Mesorhizobium sp. ORS 3428]
MKKTYEKPMLVRKGKLSAITAVNAPVVLSNPPPG